MRYTNRCLPLPLLVAATCSVQNVERLFVCIIVRDTCIQWLNYSKVHLGGGTLNSGVNVELVPVVKFSRNGLERRLEVPFRPNLTTACIQLHVSGVNAALRNAFHRVLSRLFDVDEYRQSRASVGWFIILICIIAILLLILIIACIVQRSRGQMYPGL